jgi:hypothetical protein
MLTNTGGAERSCSLRLHSKSTNSPRFFAVAGLGRRLSPKGASFPPRLRPAWNGFVWGFDSLASLRSPLLMWFDVLENAEYTAKWIGLHKEEGFSCP